MNIINESIRAFIRILNPDGTLATGVSANITARIYNPLLIHVATPTINEILLRAVFYVDFTPDALGAWLVTWDCSSPACYIFQVFDVDVDLVRALKGYSAQAC